MLLFRPRRLVALSWVSLQLHLTTALPSQLHFSVNDATERDILSPSIDRFIEDTLKIWHSPGGLSVVLVQKNGDGTWHKEMRGYGKAKADGTLVTKDTLFAIGSNSKLFDVVSCGLLISNESLSPRFSWDTKIKSIIPEWELADPLATSESTIVDLMSHRTGMPRHDMIFGAKENSTSVFSRMKHLKFSASFREIWQYNNLMYMVLSLLPERLLGTPFTRYVKDNIFTPLEMYSTTFSFDVANESGFLADGFSFTRDLADASKPIPFWNPYGGEDGNALSGPGGIISSAKDMAIWLQALLLLGKNPRTNDTVIPAEVIQKVATGVTVPIGVRSWPEISIGVYGGAQMIASYRGHEFVEHGGSTPGFQTQITRFPFDNFGLAVLSNDNRGFVETVKWRIVDEILRLEPIDWNTRWMHLSNISLTAARAALLPRPSNPIPPSVPLAAVAGIYHNDGYGTFELCLINADVPSASAAASLECESVVKDLPTLLPGAVNNSVPTLIARIEKVGVTHVRLEHFTGDLFNVSALTSMPEYNSKDSYWTFEGTKLDVITAGFLVMNASDGGGDVEGFGLTGVWGPSAGVAGPQGESKKDRAEVWFERVY